MPSCTFPVCIDITPLFSVPAFPVDTVNSPLDAVDEAEDIFTCPLLSRELAPL